MRKISGLLVVSVTGAAVLAAIADPASADVPGLVRVSATSATGPADSHTVTATCPSNKQLVGTGYEIIGGTGEVVVDEIRPHGTTTDIPTAVTVVAYQADPFGGDWSVTAYAACASPGVAGLVRISATSPLNANNPKSAIATCPAGKRLLGAGFELTGALGEVTVDDLVPNGGPGAAPTSVFVSAYETEPYAGNWNVTAYGLCADPLPGLVRAHLTATGSSDNFHSAAASCPPGRLLLGAGYEMSGANGEAVVDDLIPNAVPSALSVGAYEEDPFGGNWSVTAIGICASSLSAVSNTSPDTLVDSHSATATCPSGRQLTGGAFEMLGPHGYTIVDDLEPNGNETAAPTSMTAYAYQADGPFESTWSVTAYAICSAPLPGLVRISETSQSNSDDFRSVTAACTDGKQLVGTGFEVIGATGEVAVDGLEPDGGPAAAPTAVTVSAYETEPYDQPWSVTAYAMCANALPGLVRVLATSVADSNDFHEATATCPINKHLVGTGYRIDGAQGEALVEYFRPDALPNVPPTSIHVTAQEEDPFAGSWSVTAHAICVSY